MIIRLHRPLKNARLTTVSQPRPGAIMPVEPAARSAPVETPPPPTAMQPSEPTLTPWFSALEEQLNELESRRQQSLSELRELAVELAMAATAKVLRDAVDAETFPLVATIEEMMSAMASDEPMIAYVCPDQADALIQQMKRSPGYVELQEKLTIKKRPGLPPGSCLVESPRHALFFDLNTQLNLLRQTFLESLDAAETERRENDQANASLQRFPDRRSVG